MFTAEELEERKSYIGASDAAAVCGRSRWGTPLSIWAEKTGRLPAEDIGHKIYVRIGNKMEQVVADLFTEETGKKVHKVNEAFVHKVHPFLRCHIDRKVEGERAILQCKTAGAFKGKEWNGDEIPDEYVLQEIHELACSGYDRAYIACLIGNHDFKIKVIERDAKQIRDLVDREVKFWEEFIVPKVMPTMAYVKAADGDTALALFPQAESDDEVDLGDDADNLLEVLEGLKADGKVVENQKKEVEAKIKLMMGGFSCGKSPHFQVKWSNISQTRVDSDRLRDEAPEVFKKYSKAVLMRRFDPKRVTEGKQ